MIDMHTKQSRSTSSSVNLVQSRAIQFEINDPNVFVESIDKVGASIELFKGGRWDIPIRVSKQEELSLPDEAGIAMHHVIPLSHSHDGPVRSFRHQYG